MPGGWYVIACFFEVDNRNVGLQQNCNQSTTLVMLSTSRQTSSSPDSLIRLTL
jgi:hypothetical protein